MDNHPFITLNLDWVRTGSSQHARAALVRWATTEPLLDGFSSPAELVIACHDNAVPDPQAVLGAAVRHVPDDELAARTVLQAILPGLVAISRRAQSVGGGRLVGEGRPFGSHRELCTDIVSIAYERIRSGVDGRCPWPTTKILDSTWMRIRTLSRIHRRLTLVETGPSAIAHEPRAEHERSTAEQLATVLIDATRNGSLSRHDAALLYTNRVLGHPIADIAHALGRHPNSLRRSRRQAEQALLGAAS